MVSGTAGFDGESPYVGGVGHPQEVPLPLRRAWRRVPSFSFPREGERPEGVGAHKGVGGRVVFGGW